MSLAISWATKIPTAATVGSGPPGRVSLTWVLAYSFVAYNSCKPRVVFVLEDIACYLGLPKRSV